MQDSSLIIGCRTCAHTYLESSSNKLNDSGFPFPFSTAYHGSEVKELTYYYTCPFCESACYLSPTIKEFIMGYFDAPFHIHIHEDVFEIVTESITLTIPIDQKEKLITDVMEQFGLNELSQTEDNFPEVEEIKEIQRVASEIDRKKWLIQLKSNHIVDYFVSANDFWFGDYE